MTGTPWAILDSSIYIGHWERGQFEDCLAEVRRSHVVRWSAVVLSELRRGARTRASQELVDSLHHRATVVWNPTESDWWEAGQIVRTIGDAEGWETARRREFQNDVLIALTARAHGSVVVTANGPDFLLLQRALRIRVLVAKS